MNQEDISFDPALFHHQLKYKAEFERQKANQSFFAGDPNILDLRTLPPQPEENDAASTASSSTNNEVKWGYDTVSGAVAVNLYSSESVKV